MRHHKLVALLVVVVGVAGLASVAWAFFTAQGAGVAGAQVATLSAPTEVAAVSNTGGVTVTWQDSTSPQGDEVDGYFVERITNGDATPACNSGPTAPDLIPAAGSDPTCVDAPGTGTFSYRVTAVWRTWTATSDESDDVTISGDAAAPDAAITFPSNGTTYNAAAFAAGCTPTGLCGTATDTAGVSQVRVSIKRQSGDLYWDGSAFTLAAETFHAATVTPASGSSVNWAYALPTPADGGYTIHVQATDANGNEQTGTTYAALGTFSIDGTAPTVASVSSTLANGAYTVGQVVPVSVNFSEPVLVTGTPELALATGNPASTPATYTGGSGTSVLTFAYTVAAGNTSSDLDYVSTSALTLPSGATIRDAAANAAVTTLPAPGAATSLAGAKSIVIDTASPTVVSVSSTKTNGSYKAGVSIPVTVTFNEPVVVTGTPRLTLETGASDAVVDYASGSGTATITFGYTVAAGHTSTDLDYVSTSSLALNGGAITDVATNTGVLALPAPGGSGSLGANKALVVDTTAPYVSSINRNSSSPTNNSSLTWTVTFNEQVTGVGTGDFDLDTSGVSGASVSSVSGSGATRTVTVASGSGSGSIGLDLVDDNSIEDAALNPLGASGGGANGDFAGQAYTLDKTAPTATSIDRVGASRTNASSVSWTVTFSESVSGVDSGDFALAQSGVSGAAITGVTGSGATRTVAATTGSGSGSLGLNLLDNDSIQDGVGNNLNGTLTGQTYTLDRTGPTVTLTQVNGTSRTFPLLLGSSVTSVGGACGTATGDVATVTVTVTGAASQSGTATCTAGAWTYTASPTLTAQGAYTITATQADDLANSGTSGGKSVTVDTTAPSVSSIAFVGDSDGQVELDEKIVITFSEALSPTTVCSAWADDGTDKTINANNALTATLGANDVLTVTATAGACSTFRLGAINLGGNYNSHASQNITFSGTGSKTTDLVWDFSDRTLTIELGDRSNTGTVGTVASPGGTASWTPTSGITDRAGNGLGTGPFTDSNEHF